MANSICTSNLTSGFIDLATYDELEKYMYGGPDATAYFVRQTRKATWFTQVPVVLSRASGTPGFGQQWSVSISRAGDYLLYTWLRFTLPAITSATATTPASTGNGTTTTQTFLSWTPNLAHNLVLEACITFNDLVAARFDSWYLDFWSSFTLPGSKQIGYANMIGTTSDLIDPSLSLPAKTLNLPLPFFYSRDSGVSLPTAALPYNDMRLNFSFRNLFDLLSAWDVVTPVGGGTVCYKPGRPATAADLANSNVDLSNVQVWANYAIVSNDERKRMACAPRDILIEQVQTAPIQTYTPTNTPSYDIRFSHAIKVLFFAVQNTTIYSYWSNYTTSSPSVCSSSTDGTYLLFTGYFPGSDPIAETSLVYENTQRLANMGSDYFSLVEPFYAAPSIPVYAGYHVYSYSLDFICLDPLGSTNYGKLTNVSINPYSSPDAQTASQIVTNLSCPNPVVQQSFRFIVLAVNNNIIRISGGAKSPSAPNSRLPERLWNETFVGKQCNIPLISCF